MCHKWWKDEIDSPFLYGNCSTCDTSWGSVGGRVDDRRIRSNCDSENGGRWYDFGGYGSRHGSVGDRIGESQTLSLNYLRSSSIDVFNDSHGRKYNRHFRRRDSLSLDTQECATK